MLGVGLVATAWAPDGTIEGLEDPAQLALFRALVDAASGRATLGTLAA